MKERHFCVIVLYEMIFIRAKHIEIFPVIINFSTPVFWCLLWRYLKICKRLGNYHYIFQHMTNWSLHVSMHPTHQFSLERKRLIVYFPMHHVVLYFNALLSNYACKSTEALKQNIMVVAALCVLCVCSLICLISLWHRYKGAPILSHQIWHWDCIELRL